MRDLVRLEFIFSRRALLVNLGIFLPFFAWIAGQIDSPRTYLVMLVLVLGFGLPLTVLGREDKFKTAGLVRSLPVRPRQIVLAKQVVTWGAMAAGAALALLVAAALPFSRVPLAEVLTLRNLFLVPALFSLFLAFEVPLTVRFGLKGILFLMVGAQLAGVLLLSLVQLLGPEGVPFRGAIRAVEAGIRAILRLPGTPANLALFAAAAVALNAAALAAGTVLAARREV